MTERARPVLAFAIKTRGLIDFTSITDCRADLLAALNRPAGQRIIAVRITEVPQRRAKRAVGECAADEK